ncbi:MAG: hypothetical protein ACI4ES_10165 [Roseburia sp.]
MDAKEILKLYFGYGSFKHGQEEIIDAILAGRDVLAIMPTGLGKRTNGAILYVQD